MRLNLLKRLKDRPVYTVILFITIYTLYSSFCAIIRYYGGYYSAFDLGIYMQSLWTSVNGESLLYTTLWEGSRFAMHFEPIMFFIMPFYALFSRAETLLVLQSLALGLGALPIFWMARDELGEKAGVVLAGLYLLYPALHGINQDEFHSDALAIPFLLFSFYMFKKKRYIWGMGLAVLAMMCKENVPLVVIFMGLYWLWEERDKIKQYFRDHVVPRDKEIIYPLSLIVISSVWFYLAVYVAIPHFNPEGEHVLLNRYESPIQDLFADPGVKIGYLICLFTPLLFTSLLHPPTLMIGFPIFVQNLATDHVDMYHIWTQHPAFLVPWIFISSIYGIKNIPKLKIKRVKDFYIRWLSSGRLYRWQIGASIVGLLGMSIIGPIAGRGLTPMEITVGLSDTASHYRTLQRAIDLIDGPVYAQSNLFPFVCHRMDAYHTFEATRFFEGYRRATGDDPIPWSDEVRERGFDYILMDEKVHDPIIGAHLQKTYMMEVIDAESKLKLLMEYGLYAEGDGISLYKKGYIGKPIALD